MAFGHQLLKVIGYYLTQLILN